MNDANSVLPQTAEQAVANGARALDRVRPRWFEEIDTDKLDMQSEDWDVIGQTWGPFSTHAHEVANLIDPDNEYVSYMDATEEPSTDQPLDVLMTMHGFSIDYYSDGNDELVAPYGSIALGAAWILEIQNRRTALDIQDGIITA